MISLKIVDAQDYAELKQAEEFWRLLSQFLIMVLASERKQKDFNMRLEIPEDAYYAIEWDKVVLHEHNDYEAQTKILRVEDRRHE